MLNKQEQEYVESVCSRVKWKQAHSCIKRELTDHIDDQREAFVTEGMPEDEASASAIREMGDPAVVGDSMDKAYRPRTEPRLIIAFAAIFAAGCIIKALLGQLDLTAVLSILAGAALFIAVWRLLSLRVLTEFSLWIVGGYTLLLLVVVLLLFFTSRSVIGEVYGSIYSYSKALVYLSLFQPVALALLAWRLRGRSIPGLIILLAFCALTLFFILLSDSNILVFTTAAIDLFILIYTAAKGWLDVKRRRMLTIAVIGICVVAAAAFLMTLADYQIERLMNIFGIYEGEDFMTANIHSILGSCGLFAPADTSKLTEDALFMLQQSANGPLMKSSYMLVYLASQAGLWIYAAVIALTGTLSAFTIRACLRQSSMLARYISLSVIGAFIVQWLTYFASNLGLTIATLPMPFLSSGNISLIVNMLLMGLLMCAMGKGWVYPDPSPQKFSLGRRRA